MKKAVFCICENKDAVTAKLISAFVSATLLERFIYFLNPKFQASIHFLWLNSHVYVGPISIGSPEDRFSHDEAQLWEN